MRFRVAREPSSLLSFFATVWLTGSEEQGRKEIGIIDCETFTRGMFSNYLVHLKKKKRKKLRVFNASRIDRDERLILLMLCMVQRRIIKLRRNLSRYLYLININRIRMNSIMARAYED